MVATHRVLVAGADTFVGLAAIRSLGRRGIEVHCAQRFLKGIGRFSRYCSGVLCVPQKPQDVRCAVLEYTRHHAITHIMAVSEDMVGILNDERSTLARQAELLFPPNEIFHRALYKDRTLSIARQAGLDVPRTVYPGSTDDPALAGLSFPVVLKPRHRDLSRGDRALFLLKADQARDPGELRRKLAACAGPELPMVQEYVSGRGLGVCLLMRNGDVVCASQHLRLRESAPPVCGMSVYCRTVPLDPELLTRSVRLLRAMQWDGVAMIEYRHDEAAGRSWLLEVNGRFWGSLPLALHAGADFPYLLYRSSFESVEPCVARPNVYARMLAGDTKALLASLARGKTGRAAAAFDYLRAFRPRVKYFIWSVRDPMPAFRKLVHRSIAPPAVGPLGAGETLGITA